MKIPNTAPRFDLTFSYWILVWFLLYYNKFISYNPKIWYIFTLISVFIILLLMVYYNNNIYYILIFIFITILIKIIPLWLLRKTKIQISDFLFGFGLYFTYIIWLHINGMHYTEFTQKSYNNVKNDVLSTPAAYYLYMLYKKFNT